MAYKVAIITGADAPSQASSTLLVNELEQAGHQAAVLPCHPELTAQLRQERPDACLIDAQGRLGRSGDVQGLLTLLGLPFVGSDTATCRETWSVCELERVLSQAQEQGDSSAAMPYSVTLGASCFLELGAAAALDLVEQRIPGGYPLVVQPARGVSSRLASTPEELGEAIHAVLGLDDEVVIREWVEGVHLTVAILGDLQDLQVLPPVEVVRGDREVLDEERGIGKTTTDYFAPVRLESLSADLEQAQAIRSEIERTALDAYLACGCRDLGTVDLVWDGARARVLAVDTAPALGAGEIVALACEAAQITLGDLLDTLVSIAVERGC